MRFSEQETALEQLPAAELELRIRLNLRIWAAL